MNMRKHLFLFLVVLSLSVNAQDYQASEDTIGNLCHPVKTTASGFTAYLKETYNHPDYAQEVLPNNFEHIIQLLEHGKNNQQSRAYVQSVMRLFAHKMKACPYINAQAFYPLLTQLPNLLENHCLTQRGTPLSLLHEKINALFFERFKHEFSAFQDNPTSFFNRLSQDIIDTLGIYHDDLINASIADVQKTVLVFLEVGLSKLIWNPEDQLQSWHSVKAIADTLVRLADRTIISELEDLNGLFITLLERYCFFLDIASDNLTSEFYMELARDIQASHDTLLELEEQEACIETKKERLLRVIDKAQKAKQRS